MNPDQDTTRKKLDGLTEEEETISILRYVNVLIKRRWLIILGTLGICVLAIIFAKLQTPVYEASASFLPARSQDMSSRLDVSFGVGRTAVDRNADTLYLIEYYSQILLSRDFLRRIANKPLDTGADKEPQTLLEYYRNRKPTSQAAGEMTLEKIRQSLRVVPPKGTAARASSTFIILTYAAPDPAVAAAVVNLALDELVLFNQNEQMTKSKANREFIENQLKETRRLLSEAETASSSFQKKNRLIATPELQVELDRLKRNVRLQEEIYITLNKQLELAKIQEQETNAPIIVVQRATPPRSRTKPKLKKTAYMAGFLGIALFSVLALGLDFGKRMNRDDPDTKEFLAALEDVKGDVKKAGRIFRGRGRKTPPAKK